MYLTTENGEIPEILARPDSEKGELYFSSPEILPGGEAVLFTATTSKGREVRVLSFESGEEKVLLEKTLRSLYSPSGHLLNQPEGAGDALMAIRFDLARLEVTGSQVPVLEGIRGHSYPTTPLDFSFSNDGTLVYVPRSTTVGSQLVWVDSEGARQEVPGEIRNHCCPRISSDGKRIAFTQFEAGGLNQWIYDLGNDSFSRLTFQEGVNGTSTWSPDGKWLAYVSDELGQLNVYVSPLSDSETKWLVSGSDGGTEPVWSPHGNEIYYRSLERMIVVSVQTEPTFSTTKPRILFEGSFRSSSLTPGYQSGIMVDAEQGIDL